MASSTRRVGGHQQGQGVDPAPVAPQPGATFGERADGMDRRIQHRTHERTIAIWRGPDGRRVSPVGRACGDVVLIARHCPLRFAAGCAEAVPVFSSPLAPQLCTNEDKTELISAIANGTKTLTWALLSWRSFCFLGGAGYAAAVNGTYQVVPRIRGKPRLAKL